MTASVGLFVLASTSADAASKPNATTLVIASSEGFSTAVVDHFENATGIHVKLVPGTTAAVIADLSSRQYRTKWGVVWVDGPPTLATLDHHHKLVRGVSAGSNFNSLGARLEPKDHSYVPLGETLADVVLYTSRAVTDPPTSWSQLLHPQWKGEIAMANPRLSASAYPAIAGLMYSLGGNTHGVHAGEVYFSHLKRNKLTVKTTYAQVVHEIVNARGKLAILPSSVAVAAAQRHPSLRIAYLPPATVDAPVVGIDAGSSKAEKTEARAFVSYLLSVPGQQLMQRTTLANGSFFYPVVSGVTALSALPPLSGITTQVLTPYVWGPRQAAVLGWFNTHVTK